MQFNPEELIYAQLHYAGNGKRTFRVYCFEFSSGVLGIRKDARVSHHSMVFVALSKGVQKTENRFRFGF